MAMFPKEILGWRKDLTVTELVKLDCYAQLGYSFSLMIIQSTGLERRCWCWIQAKKQCRWEVGVLGETKVAQSGLKKARLEDKEKVSEPVYASGITMWINRLALNKLCRYIERSWRKNTMWTKKPWDWKQLGYARDEIQSIAQPQAQPSIPGD